MQNQVSNNIINHKLVAEDIPVSKGHGRASQLSNAGHEPEQIISQRIEYTSKALKQNYENDGE
jgi:hypothetical protein